MIIEAFIKSEGLKSKIPDEYFVKLTGGLGSKKIWHLLNNLCDGKKSYLELGAFMGASLMASMYENNLDAYTIDNWCLKPIKNHFLQNTKQLKFRLFEQDAFTVNLSQIKPIDVYFCDGEHTYEAQYKGLQYFLPVMKDEFVFVVDDWNNEPVRRGTEDAIADMNLKVLEFEERRNRLMKDKDGWWCGIAAYKLSKI